MGSADAMTEALDKLSAKIDDMKVALDKLAPSRLWRINSPRFQQKW
jgi:hypothetical protein